MNAKNFFGELQRRHVYRVAVAYAIGQSAPLVASLWGIFVWKEFAGAPPAATRALAAMFVFYIAAIGILSRAI